MGWTFNTVDPNAPTDGPKISAVAIVMTTLAMVAVILRVYVRQRMVKAFGADDWVIVYAWLQYMGAPFYITSILAFKLSLLLSYLRFMPKGAYRYTTCVVILLTVLFHLAFLLVQINLCQPVQAQWDPSIVDKTCLPSVPVYTAMASLTILFDVTAMVLPFPVLMSLKMQNRRKVVLLGLFGLGIFITIIQIIRIQTVKRLVVYTDSAPLIMWSAVEANLGVIVASVPCLSPLIKYFRERSTTGSKGKSGGTGYQVGSQYALRTWKSTHNARDADMGGSLSGHRAKAEATVTNCNTDSTEYILEPTKIMAKTEITVTRV
ncbi:integral membrane protein [Diaporthe eres]|nr:integral membrane protein [Diaporthe eres]